MPNDLTLEQVQALITRAPFHQWLGLSVLAVTDTSIEIKATWREEWVVNTERRYTHGGILAALIDLAADYDGVAANAFRGAPTRFCVISFTSDWLFPTSESRALVHALNASSARVSFAEIETDRGHDAFLLDVPEFFDIARAFLQSAGKARGL